jgi:hypothetical protein
MEETLRTIDTLEDLRQRVDYLTLVSEALWSFLQEQGHTEAELVKRIETIDLSDGTRDRRHTHRSRCMRCGSMITTTHCQFCGARRHDPFDQD